MHACNPTFLSLSEQRLRLMCPTAHIHQVDGVLDPLVSLHLKDDGCFTVSFNALVPPEILMQSEISGLRRVSTHSHRRTG